MMMQQQQQQQQLCTPKENEKLWLNLSMQVGDEEALRNFSQTLEPVTLKIFEDVGRLSLWVWRKRLNSKVCESQLPGPSCCN
jgi:hypothetical protein